MSPWYGLGGDVDEALHALDRAEHAHDAAEAARRHAGVVGVAGEAHLVFGGDGDDALEEVGDALPGGVRRDAPAAVSGGSSFASASRHVL